MEKFFHTCYELRLGIMLILVALIVNFARHMETKK